MTTHQGADTGRETVLEAYDVLVGSRRRDLEALADLAARLAGVPFAAISLVTADTRRQVVTVGPAGRTASHDEASCLAVLESQEPVLVSDARTDPRFADTSHANGGPGSIRYYGAHPLRTPRGVVIGTLCVYDELVRPVASETAGDLAQLADRVVDLLELELASRRLSAAHERLERADERLGAFAAQISHDLKNPLTSLSLSLEMLEAEVGEHPAPGVVIARARRSSARMTQMIGRLSEFASTGAAPRRHPVDLGAEIADLIEDLGAGLDSARVTVGPLPTVTGDPSQLRSLMQHLIDNAVKFTRPDEPPEIAVSAVEEDGAHRIEVADRGPGVPPEHREHVFAPLTRLNRGVRGLGIGLATCRRIVEAHDGRIGVEARDGGGSVFWFALPTGSSGQG